MLLVQAHVKLGGRGLLCMSKTAPDPMFSSGQEKTNRTQKLIWAHFILFINMWFYEKYRLNTARCLTQSNIKQHEDRKLWGSAELVLKHSKRYKII